MRKITMRRMMLPAGAAVAAVCLAAGCSGTTTTDDAGSRSAAVAERSASPAGAPRTAEDAAMRDVKLTGSGYEDHAVWGPRAYVVRYAVTNGGSDPADYFAQLEFLDADGDVLGSTGITADKLGPGKSSKGDTAPLKAEIRNGPITGIKDVRVSQVVRTAVE